MGIQKTHAPLWPQSDGMMQRFNCIIVHELAKRCTEGQTEWNRKFPLLLMAYRSAEHEATTYTPARLLLERELRLPVDVVTGHPPDEELPVEIIDYAIVMRKCLEEIHQVRDHLKFAGETI